MSIGLDNPGLLPLLPLVGLPLLLHLMARPRPRPCPFPSLMLLNRAHRQNARVRRPHHWLLLLLRTLWVLLLLLVFLQPRHRADRPPAESPDGSRSVVVVLDATASMRAREGAQSRHARAVSETVDILQALGPRDRANVIRVRAVPESLYPEPGVNTAHLIQEIRRLPATHEGGSLRDAVALAVEQLREHPAPRELILVSDFQPGAWDDTDLSLPPDTIARALAVASESLENQAVTAIRFQPAEPVAGQETLVEVEVRNHGPSPVRRSLTLRVGERIEQQEVELPPNGTVRVPLRFTLEGEGDVPVVAELEADAFPADDLRRAVLRLRPGLLAGVSGDDPTARTWLRTLDALPAVRAIRVENLGALPEGLDALLISGWSGAALDSVRRHAEAGGLLMIRPEGGTDAMLAWIGAEGRPPPPGRLDPPRGLRVPEPWPDLLRVFEDGRHGSPARALVYRHAAPPLPPDALEPLLTLDNGDPVWGRLTRVPSAYLWTLSLDPEDSNLAAQPEWVTLFGEWLFGARRPAFPPEQTAGTRLTTGRERLPAETPRLVSLEGDEIPHAESGNALSAAEPLPPGFYAWENPATREQLVLHAVNLPPEESDLRVAAPEVGGDGVPLSPLARASDLATLREGRPLWPWLLALALLVAAAEQIATGKAVKA